MDLAEFVSLARILWRIERDSQEMDDEVGLDHHEGRGWRGFHHHTPALRHRPHPNGRVTVRSSCAATDPRTAARPFMRKRTRTQLQDLSAALNRSYVPSLRPPGTAG
jgi:hypothetical protein